ncbi:MAG: class II glutamine amidotransferase [Oscillospiraceae bacterium]|nr:class II glutamine amidotransferase [Oscillospiraceae bacterium]
MCAVFGFMDYGRKTSAGILKRLLRELSVAAETRGIDATGISYVSNGNIVTFKKALPAHKVKLYFPKGTRAVTGHTRFTTQGSENMNYNNHPFTGKTAEHAFALAHNGVLYNDQELRKSMNIPDTVIQTDSYIAVQLLEKENKVDMISIKNMSESVDGNFVFTVLRDDNTLFIARDNNPVTLLHYPELGLYVYASTNEILTTALRAVKLKSVYEEIRIHDGDIICIDSNGKLSSGAFDNHHYSSFSRWFSHEKYRYDNDYAEDLFMICGCYGVNRETIEELLDLGYTCDEIEEMLLDGEL